MHLRRRAQPPSQSLVAALCQQPQQLQHGRGLLTWRGRCCRGSWSCRCMPELCGRGRARTRPYACISILHWCMHACVWPARSSLVLVPQLRPQLQTAKVALVPMQPRACLCLQEAASAASAALDAAREHMQGAAGPPPTATTQHAAAPARSGTGAAGASAGRGMGGQDAESRRQGGDGAAPGPTASSTVAREQGSAGVGLQAAAAAEAAMEAAEVQQLQCLLALHALCSADVAVVAGAGGADAGYVVRGLAPFFKASGWGTVA